MIVSLFNPYEWAARGWSRRPPFPSDILDRLVVVLFIMIYKGAKKGSMDAFGSCRPIELVMHAFKLVDVVFLEELVEDIELFLSPAQEGYRANRGARTCI